MSQNSKPTPLQKLVKDGRFIASAFLLITGSWLDIHNSATIQANWPNRQPIPDSLFLLLPYIGWTQYFSDLANIFSIILLAIYLFPQRWQKLPFALSILGLGYLLRSMLELLNPYGGPLGNIAYYGITKIHQFGQFPSGHTMLVVIIYYLIDRDEAPLLSNLALGSIAVEVASLLLSHGHYSIDIVGGFFVAYFSYHELKKHQSQLTIPEEN